MKSPITGKEMKLLKDQGVLTYRKENFKIVYHYFLCEDTGERFTNDEIDDINQIQVHNQYREKYGIPFPEEIVAIREKYAVSASKMSEILGLGANTYRLYEAGEMPSVANGRLILSIKEPLEFLKQVVASSHILTEKEQVKFRETALLLSEKAKKSSWDSIFEKKIFSHQIPDEYCGYKEPDINVISNVIAFFDQKMNKLWKTKLNKLLFYADFCHYQKTGYSLTGIAYRAISYGPVPAEYHMLFAKLYEDKKVEIRQWDLGDGYYGEEISSNIELDRSLFTEIQLSILDQVSQIFADKTTSETVNISHQEKAWIENEQEKKMISYQKYAFSINGMSC